MNQHLIQQTHSHDMVANDPPTGIEQENHEAFPFEIEVRMRSDVKPPVVGDPLRHVTALTPGRRAFWSACFL